MAKIDGQVKKLRRIPISNLLDLARNKPPVRETKELLPFLEKLVADFAATATWKSSWTCRTVRRSTWTRSI